MKKVFTILVFMLLAACAPPEQAPTVAEEIQVRIPTMPEKPLYEPPPTPPTEGVVEIHIEAKMFEFLPSEIKVKKGDKVKLIITSVDVPHTFTLVAYNIDEELKVGEDKVIEFTADKEGTFTFTCEMPGHKTNGMTGKLTVT